MAYSAADARREMLAEIAAATEQLGVAVAALGEAYEGLDEHNADRLEEELFRPVQTAYGRAQRTHAGFAERHGLPGRAFTAAVPGHPSQGVSGFLDAAVSAVLAADGRLAELQDSMRPVEVGDDELRAGLSEVRRLVGDVPARTRRLASTLGR
jgi:hypothetical protein